MSPLGELQLCQLQTPIRSSRAPGASSYGSGSLSFSLTHSLLLSFSLSPSLTLLLYFSLSRYLNLLLSHKHFLSLCLSIYVSQLTSLTLSHSPSLLHTFSLSLSIYLSLSPYIKCSLARRLACNKKTRAPNHRLSDNNAPTSITLILLSSPAFLLSS